MLPPPAAEVFRKFRTEMLKDEAELEAGRAKMAYVRPV